MIRNLKALGLALFAIFAMGALAASAASAQQGTLTSDGPMTLIGVETGAGANFLESFGIKVECPGSTYTAHKTLTHAETTAGKKHELIPSGATAVTLTPHYKQVTAEGKINCKAAGSFPATVDMNGCDYDLTLGETTVGATPDTYGVKVDIICPPEKEITVTVFTTEAEDPTTPFCTLHIKAQNNLAGLDIRDTTNGHLDLTGKAEGIHVLRTNHGAHGLLCPNNTTTATASFSADVAVEGRNAEGETTKISISHP